MGQIHMDTRITLVHFKLLTSIQSTVPRMEWLSTTAVHQEAVAALGDAAAPSTEWLTLAMILRIAGAMVDRLRVWRPWLEKLLVDYLPIQLCVLIFSAE